MRVGIENIKRNVTDKASRIGVVVTKRRIDEARPRRGCFIVLVAPEGKRFRDGPGELLCDDWQDAWQRIRSAQLIDDEND